MRLIRPLFFFALLSMAHGVLFSADRKPGPQLQLHKWSGDINVPDPVALSLDSKGRVYVTQTTRRKTGDLDIREHAQWIPFDVALEDIEQKKAFFHEVLAPGKFLRPEGGLKDQNGDGSIDWKDLTVPTERIYRLEDSDGDGTADKRTVYAEGFNTEVTGIAAGVLWHDGYVYCTIAPDLWRLRDSGDNGVADERESIVHGFGHHIAYAGHDMHGLCVGPDGRIYWTIGDKGVNVHTKDGRHVAEPHQGCVLRCEPDGTGFEIFAHGLRNLQEIAFDEFGNIFGVDNDADKPGEKERVVYVTERSDSGWRCSYQYLKGYCPWIDEGLWQPRCAGQPEYITPPLANYHDGPAGFAYNPGTALSAAWRGCFFCNQFPGGRMSSFRVQSDGASFKIKDDRTVASGVMGIGLSWSPDGKLFMADWGGDYPLKGKGAVWSLDDPTGEGSTERKETQELLTQGFGQWTVNELSMLLGHADQRVRRGAQFEMVKRGEYDAMQHVALNAARPRLARIHALWGMGQGYRCQKALHAPGLIKALINDKDAEVRAQLAKIMGDAPSLAPLGADLIPMLKDSSARVRFHAAIAVGKLGVASATEALLNAVKANADRDAYLRHALVTGLTGCAPRETLLAAASNKSRPVRLACALALRRRTDAGMALFLRDADDGIASEAARAIHDDGSIPELLPELAALLDESRAWPEAVQRRALNACFRLGGKADAERVFQYALREDAPPELREEALTLARLWCDPPPLDRLDGRARKLESRDPQAVIAAAQPRIEAMMALKDTDLKTLAVQILATYSLPVSAPAALEAAMDGKSPSEVRIEALRLLVSQHPRSQELQEGLDKLIHGKTPESLRSEALGSLLVEDPDLAVKEAARLLDSGTVREKQKALGILAAAKSPEADAILVTQMDALAEGKAAPPVQLDILQAAQARSANITALAGKVAAFEKSRAAAAGTTAAFAECLEGGDPKAGREIAHENLAANCMLCHRFEAKEGSNVGPPLGTIGKQRDRAYLLESLIAPTAQIAAGYGVVALTMKKGPVISGALAAANDQELQIRLADGTLKKVPLEDIKSKTDPVSLMPPMGSILNKQELRDLLAYLASLDGSGSKKKKKK